MCNHGSSRTNANCSLKELNDLLKASCEAVTCGQGGDTYYSEDVQIFREVATEKGLLLTEAPRELSETPSDAGNEHQVWFREERKTFLKATHPNYFGKKVIYRIHETPDASPVEYIERWLLHNEMFGDSVTFLGGLETEAGLRLIIEQPAIIGEAVTPAQVDQFFTQHSWNPFHIEGILAYYDEERHVVISDTHAGNILRISSGLLLPIDLRVQKLTPALVDIVKHHIKS